ncbi:MAG: DNA replication/repair protein RecF [Cyclobacteriaceae bacterium]
MHLENLSLVNFKNYAKCDLGFSSQINCFVGPNGSGKTNLLDAIHYLSLTKSAFNTIDQQNIRHGTDYFAVNGTFALDGRSHTIKCSLKTGEKKQFKNGSDRYEKLSQHIGLFPLILITPYDTEIIREGSELRRKFFDNLLAQIDQDYLNQLIEYNHYLRQRNKLLKQFQERNYFDPNLLESYDRNLIGGGQMLSKCRVQLLNDYLPFFKQRYQEISDGNEEVTLTYRSDLLEGNFPELFRSKLQKDMALQRTTMGIHKDDFLFELEGHPIKKLGSQGQQKSFVIALKLAQFELIKKAKGFKPLLLMDDIFDKLDDQRIAKLMDLVAGKAFGQLFVTDARPERTKAIFETVEAEVKLFGVNNGEVAEVAE